MDEVAIINEQIRPLRVSEYLALAELGVFGDERVELLRGRVVRMAPESNEHAWAMETLNNLLVERFGKWAAVRPNLPLRADEFSMPQPDFALIPRRNRPGPHPERALLLVEVAKTSRRFDRLVKAPLYAEGGSPEYWIVNVARWELEVYRTPRDGEWKEHFTLSRGQTIRPVSFPEVELELSEFLLAATPH